MAESLKYPYCTLLSVQEETRNSVSSNEDKMIKAINLASRQIDSFCRRDFLFHDHASDLYQVKTNQVIGNKIYLPWPVLTLTEVVVGGGALDPDSYFFENGEATAMIMFDRDLPSIRPSRRIQFRGTFGYPFSVENPETNPPEIPEAVSRAATLIASAWSGENRKDQVGLDGSKVSILDNTIPAEAKTLLQKFVWRFL